MVEIWYAFKYESKLECHYYGRDFSFDRISYWNCIRLCAASKDINCELSSNEDEEKGKEKSMAHNICSFSTVY